MGAEKFADRKQVQVFIPNDAVPEDGSVAIGIERSGRRCTLIACIALDGTRLEPAIVTKYKTVNSQLFENGLTPENITAYWTPNSFINGDVFEEWLTDVFLPHVELTRTRLRERLGQFNEKAVLVMDGCRCHTQERHLQLLEEHDVDVRLLVPHTSHLTQPLDLGVFGQVKSLLRGEATYAVDVGRVDDAVAEELDPERAPGRRRAERGFAMAEYVADIVDAYERATTRRRVVSAFRQAGILYKTPDPVEFERRAAYTDPSHARAVVRQTGLFAGWAPVERPARRSIRVEHLRLNRRRRVHLNLPNRPSFDQPRRPAPAPP